jgi:DNA-directed RNA polymerase subunit RPC12/RpoP
MIKKILYKCLHCGQTVGYPQENDNYYELRKVICIKCGIHMECLQDSRDKTNTVMQPSISVMKSGSSCLPKPIGVASNGR